MSCGLMWDRLLTSENPLALWECLLGAMGSWVWRSASLVTASPRGRGSHKLGI